MYIVVWYAEVEHRATQEKSKFHDCESYVKKKPGGQHCMCHNIAVTKRHIVCMWHCATMRPNISCEHKALSVHNMSLQTIRRRPTMQNIKYTKSQTSDMPNNQLQPSQVAIATCCLSFEPVIAAAKPLGIYGWDHRCLQLPRLCGSVKITFVSLQ